ncbi:MAG: Gfo/Idh/MocA family oxidoreductase [Treponema sp.]|jgi:predicted dehydrogenase|nr:Gfo/Idh/MocA family oxidoreductase [Treponema sp.]
MNVGILGAGSIAEKMAQTLNRMKGVAAAAVASRDLDRAGAFAGKYNIKKYYGSYLEMARDPGVDLIYVATPHSHHYEHMKLCLEQGKHVLCEKAFTVNAAQAKELITLGEQKKLLVAEAIWTRYLPMRAVMDKVLAEGIIGSAASLTANLCQAVAHIERLVKPELAGGALLDMGVYAINFALMCFGSDIADISAAWVKYETGVDAMNSITFTYKDGRIAILESGFTCRSDRRGIVAGDKGYIEFLNINNCEGIRVYNTQDKLLASYKTPKQITGFEYQVEACKRAIGEGRTECPEMPHAEIIRVMEIMDRIRKIWGLTYPGEKEEALR